MHTLPSGCVLFGAFELDLSTGELRSIDAPDPSNKVLLREQVFQVLRMLLEDCHPRGSQEQAMGE